MKKFFALENENKLPKGTAKRWAKHTPNIKSLPEHAKKAYLAGFKIAMAELSGNSCVDTPKPAAGLSLPKTTKETPPMRFHKSSLENSWEHKKQAAYELGVSIALRDAGLVKSAGSFSDPVWDDEALQTLSTMEHPTSDIGNRLLLGGLLGTAGAVGGGLIGRSLGGGLGMYLGGATGGGLGAVGGSMLGGSLHERSTRNWAEMQAAMREELARRGVVKQAYAVSYGAMPLAGAALGTGLGALIGGEDHRGQGAGIGAAVGGAVGLGLGGLRHWVANRVVNQFIENAKKVMRSHRNQRVQAEEVAEAVSIDARARQAAEKYKTMDAAAQHQQDLSDIAKVDWTNPLTSIEGSSMRSAGEGARSEIVAAEHAAARARAIARGDFD